MTIFIGICRHQYKILQHEVEKARDLGKCLFRIMCAWIGGERRRRYERLYVFTYHSYNTYKTIGICVISQNSMEMFKTCLTKYNCLHGLISTRKPLKTERD